MSFYFILSLRTAHGLILALRTAYRQQQKQPFWRCHLQTNTVCGTFILANVCFVVFAWYFEMFGSQSLRTI